MEKSFDFGALLQNHEKKHKTRPKQFLSVASGVRKRLENNIRYRKSSRLTFFDSIRNLPEYDSKKKQPDPLTKEEHRRMQLEKWKEEKEKKKKLAATQKKKPFVAGVAHLPLAFVPPPPLPKAVPSTSGRVTRSQSAKNNSLKPKPPKATTQQSQINSFAPKNAMFKAPEIKNVQHKPTLVPISKIKKTKEIITFNPVLPVVKVDAKSKHKTETKVTESKRNVTDKVRNQVERKPRGRLSKAESSSSSQSENSSGENLSPVSKGSKLKAKIPKNPIKSSDKTLHVSEPPMLRTKASRRSIQTTSKVTPKASRRSIQTTSEDVSSPKFDQLNSKTKTTVKPIQGSDMTSPTSDQPLHKSKTTTKCFESTKIYTPRKPIPKSESSSEEKLRSPKSPVDVPLTPEQIVEEAKRNSPFVTLSRGKSNARREIKKKIDEGLLDEDASDVDSVDHFRRQLNSEIKRMTEMCDTWEKISEQIVLPETVQEAVLGAVGQARLLMSHKLQQFASLVARCERPEPGQGLVTPADLHGFWDMVFMQVENVDVRFKKLEEMRARNWTEEAPAAPRRKAAPKAKPLAKPAAASRLRDVIAAARKAKKQDGQPVETQESTPGAPPPPAKTFEAGFFCVQSPVRSPPASTTPARPARPSLLKAVLSSETKKSAVKNATSLAMLRASSIGKNVDGGLFESFVLLTPINLQATPGRGILKQVNVPSAKKSIKVVLFDDSDAATPDGTEPNGVGKPEDAELDSGVAVADVEKEKKQKENKTKRKSLTRQDATDQGSPMMTRSRRRSMSTPVAHAVEDGEKATSTRSARRKKALQEIESNIMEENYCTPKRSSRRKVILQGGVA